MNKFLKPLVDSANSLYTKGMHDVYISATIMFSGCIILAGIEVLTPEGTIKTVKAAIVAVSCDLPARAIVLNMRQFNGKQGCHLCEDEGTTDPNNHLVRWWPHNPGQVLRTKQSMIRDIATAVSENAIVS